VGVDIPGVAGPELAQQADREALTPYRRHQAFAGQLRKFSSYRARARLTIERRSLSLYMRDERKNLAVNVAEYHPQVEPAGKGFDLPPLGLIRPGQGWSVFDDQ
jgi:hypothetical protein